LLTACSKGVELESETTENGLALKASEDEQPYRKARRSAHELQQVDGTVVLLQGQKQQGARDKQISFSRWCRRHSRVATLSV
jgi:hypothetical protein